MRRATDCLQRSGRRGVVALAHLDDELREEERIALGCGDERLRRAIAHLGQAYVRSSSTSLPRGGQPEVLRAAPPRAPRAAADAAHASAGASSSRYVTTIITAERRRCGAAETAAGPATPLRPVQIFEHEQQRARRGEIGEAAKERLEEANALALGVEARNGGKPDAGLDLRQQRRDAGQRDTRSERRDQRKRGTQRLDDAFVGYRSRARWWLRRARVRRDPRRRARTRARVRDFPMPVSPPTKTHAPRPRATGSTSRADVPSRRAGPRTAAPDRAGRRPFHSLGVGFGRRSPARDTLRRPPPFRPSVRRPSRLAAASRIRVFVERAGAVAASRNASR